MDLTNKVALVTGASRGIGRSLALAFARRGMDVVLAGKTLDPDPRLPGTLIDVKREVEAIGRRALAIKTDVREASQIESMVKEAIDVFGAVDVLVNNAGALYWHPIVDTPASRFDLVVQVNARAAFLSSRAVIASMKARGGGAIVNMSPPIVRGATGGHVAYMISKYGMTLVSEGVAAEHAQDGIRAYSLWPATMIESQATIGHSLGTREMWRSPDILVDATLALVTDDAKLENGGAFYDEDVLHAIGVTDFDRYACVPGSKPPTLRLDDPNNPWRMVAAGRVTK